MHDHSEVVRKLNCGQAHRKPTATRSPRLADLLSMSLSILGLLVAAACSSASEPECAGTSCVCPAESSCEIGDSACGGGSCSLDCANSNECAGACGQSCSVDCSGGSTCNITVGASSSMSCGGGSTCTLKCTGSCSLSCAGGSTCQIQCAGDAQPRTVDQGATCE